MRSLGSLSVQLLRTDTVVLGDQYSSAKDDTVVHADAAEPSQCVTKSGLRQLLQQVAHTLRSNYGIGRDGPEKDVVLCISTGHYQLPTLFYATIATGGIFSASSPASTPAELAGQIQQVGAKLLLCSADLKDVAIAAAQAASLPIDRVLFYGSSVTPGSLDLAEAQSGRNVPISSELLPWRRITDRARLENSTICVLFSSGTTGQPKGVCLSHYNMISQCYIVMEPTLRYNARTNPSFQIRTLAHLPAAHIAGIQGYLVNPFYAGGTTYWMSRFEFVPFLAHMKRHRVTMFFSVPPIFLLIAKSPLVTDQFDSVETAYSGAAPMGKDLQREAQKKMGRGKAFLSQTWGLSETTGSVTAMPKGERDDTGSVSPLVGNHEARIVDDEDRDVEPGQPGEILVRGPVVTKGYFDNVEATRESFVDGWFRTGDIGFFRDGLFYIIDRKKELIKYKGVQVAPAELEALLISHPQIQDAAVIGVDGEGTEMPR